MIARRVWRQWFAAQTFLTRLPAPARVVFDTEDFPESLVWFPWVGALIGLIVGAIYLLAARFLPALSAATLAMLGLVLLTGALHEDALADTADGLGGGRDPAEVLRIMRDSHVGSYGVVALGLLMLLRVSLLAALNGTAALWALMLAHSLARASVLPLMLYLPYLRQHGAARPFVGAVPRQAMAVSALFLALGVWYLAGLVAAFVAGVVVYLAALGLKHKLDGITGDGFGAVIVVVEVTVLLVQVVCA